MRIRAAYLAIYLQAAQAQKCIALVSGRTERLTAENAQLKAAAKANDLDQWQHQIDQSVSAAQAALSAELEKASNAAAEKAQAASAAAKQTESGSKK